MTRNEANRLIAEKCENKRVLTGREVSLSGPWCEMYYESGEAQWGMDHDSLYEVKDGTLGEKKEPCLLVNPLDDYFTDIAACVRAAEAWRRQMAHKGERYWIFESGLVPEDRPSVRLYWDSGKSMQMSFGDTLEEAMASALVEAVK